MIISSCYTLSTERYSIKPTQTLSHNIVTEEWCDKPTKWDWCLPDRTPSRKFLSYQGEHYQIAWFWIWILFWDVRRG